MTVKRITANLNAPSIPELRTFYEELFGLTLQIDLGWILTLGAEASAPAQVSLATTGGEGTPVPELSIEVDDAEVYAEKTRALGYDILYGPEIESRGIRRFMLHDPANNLVNVFSHP